MGQVLKADRLEITKKSRTDIIDVKHHVKGQTLIAEQSVSIGAWRIEPRSKPGKSAGTSWLQLVTGKKPHSVDANLHLGQIRATKFTATGSATLSKVTAKEVRAPVAHFKTLHISGKVHVKEGIWVGKQRISPMPKGLLSDIQALKDELS